MTHLAINVLQTQASRIDNYKPQQNPYLTLKFSPSHNLRLGHVPSLNLNLSSGRDLGLALSLGLTQDLRFNLSRGMFWFLR